MPTAARLAAAIFFAVVGFFFAITASPYFPEAREPSYWIPLNMGVGAVIGWMVCGTRAGNGLSNVIANGLTTGIGILFWVFFLFSFHEMIKKSLRKSYDGPMEAVVDVFALMIDWVQVFLQQDLAIIMVAGCLLAAFVTELVGRRWS